ncbi:MAG: glutamate formimidoyltransferase [Chloroflexi bacterium]|nr:glutamate formimidoyltransferase [Chloroflexota bacterium]
MTQIIECVPNFSEARRPEVVQAIVEAIRSAQGVRVLNVSSDHDHNRTVVTFVGDAAAIEAGAYAGIAKAAELIDLDQHTGEHPRIGATDVAPFIPIRNASMDDCVAIARRLGERVGSGLGIPVYLYESAATRPDRENLENIRRGQYEDLKTEIANNPDRKPDFGPSKLGKAGATVIGARPFLIAYNVYLNTSDVGIAKKIARAIRQSSGGLRYVKALGLLVDGQAQVSMNLTNFRMTPVHRVAEMIRREAARYGASITRSELVGMIPQAALVDSAQWYWQLDGLQDDQIFENKLAAADLPVGAGEAANQFLDSIAAGTATPGGGAAGAYAGAMAAALVAMVARVTVGKKKYADVEPEMQELIVAAEKLRADLTASVAADIAAFDEVMKAYKLPKDSDAEVEARDEAIEKAMHAAAAAPLRVARDATTVLGLTAIAAEKGNVNAISDAGSAASLALAAARAAVLNVRINAAEVKDREAARLWLNEIASLEHSAAATFEAVSKTTRGRMRPG